MSKMGNFVLCVHHNLKKLIFNLVLPNIPHAIMDTLTVLRKCTVRKAFTCNVGERGCVGQGRNEGKLPRKDTSYILRPLVEI